MVYLSKATNILMSGVQGDGEGAGSEGAWVPLNPQSTACEVMWALSDIELEELGTVTAITVKLQRQNQPTDDAIDLETSGLLTGDDDDTYFYDLRDYATNGYMKPYAFRITVTAAGDEANYTIEATITEQIESDGPSF